LDAVSLATFVALGLPDGMLGTAWPALRSSFGVPVGDLGLVLLVSTSGSVLITVVVGYLIRRFGVPLVVATGLACAVAAGAGFALAPVFGVVVGIAFLSGVAAGLIDGGLNTSVGLSGRARLLNLLHGAYGVGTALGPLLVTLALLGGSWRPAYVVLLAVDSALCGLWLIHRRSRPRSDEPVGGTGAPSAEGPSVSDSRSGPASVRGYGPAIAAGIAMFFVYTGLEVSAGQWETTFARDHLHLSASAAGLATFGYWAALTAGRIGIALLPKPPGNRTVVRWGCLVAVVAAGLIWWDPATPVTVTGFVILGASLAGVFPALVALTPRRLGERRASDVIAWQVGAAAAGGAATSALIGLLINQSSVAVLGPSLMVLAILLVAVDLLLTGLAPLKS
jgi:fucose permease